MKEIRLKIKGSYIYEESEEDQMELVTEGKLYQRNGKIYLIYDESEMSGMVGCKTRLTLYGNKVKMSRKGEAVGIDNELNFEKGKRFSGYYETPFGPVEMEVLTNNISNNVTEEGIGSVDIDYNISLKGLSEGRSRLNIEILE